jgi:tetratricopeptide (TPR) repeat protein
MASALFEMLRRNPIRAKPLAESLTKVASEHQMPMWTGWSVSIQAWVDWKIGDSQAGVSRMRQGKRLQREQGVAIFAPFFETMLADVEAGSGQYDAALTTLDEAIDLSRRSGQCWFDTESYRTRGEILLKQNPSDPAPAEAAFLAAIAVAQKQKARSFELRAALSLAKLCRTTGLDLDAHAVLGSALEGFAPTPEFPQIAEAKALFESLGVDETVKADAARRVQRLKLQTSYGQAVMWSKGFSAEETKATFARVGELATEIGDAEATLDAYYARSVHSIFRGELGSARETAETFLGEAERGARPTEAGVAHRVLGLIRLFHGDFAQAWVHCERTLRIYDPARDREAKFRLGTDATVAATSFCLSSRGSSATSDAHGSLSTRRALAQSNLLMPRRSSMRITLRPYSKSSATTLTRPGAPRKPTSR